MGKTFRFDPDEGNSGKLSKADRKRLRQERRERRANEQLIESHMKPVDDSETGDPILDEVLQGEWYKD